MATPSNSKSRRKGPGWWTAPKDAAFEALRRGASCEEAAKLGGINRKTISDWQATPEWKKRLESRQAAYEQHAAAVELEPLDYLRERGREAAERYWLLALEAEDEQVRARVLKDILDRLSVKDRQESGLDAWLKEIFGDQIEEAKGDGEG